jgi:hypothetical protein
MHKYLIILLFIISCKDVNINNESISKEEKIVLSKKLDSIKNIIKEGDIIFRGGTDIESAIIKDFSYNDKLFSHCGIVLKKDNKLMVTHILGGTTNPSGAILSQTANDFFSYPDNESAGVYKTDLDSEQIEKLSKYIDSVKQKKVTFDLKFDLLDKSKLYCSEFVIDAIQYAKNNNAIFPITSFYLKNTKYFAVTNKGDSFLFYPLDVFQHNTLLKEKAIFYFPNYRKQNP